MSPRYSSRTTRLNSKGPLIIQSLYSNSTNSSSNCLGITDNNPIDTDKSSVTAALAPLQHLTNRMDAHSHQEDELPYRSAHGSSSSTRGEDTAATSLAENSHGDDGDAVSHEKNSKQQDDDDEEVVAGDDIGNADEDVGFGPPPAFPSSNKALGKRKHTVLEVSAAANAKLQDDSSEEEEEEEGGDRNKQSQMIHRMKTTETTKEERSNDDNSDNDITMNKSGEYYDAMLLASLSDLDQIHGLNKAGSLTARSPTDETEDDINSPNPSTTGHTPSVAPTPTRSNVNPNTISNRPYALMPKSGPLYTTPNSKQGIATSSAVGVSNNPQHSPDRRNPKAITPRSAEGRGGPLPEGMMYGGRNGPPPHHYQYPGYHHHPGYPPPHHSQHYPPPPSAAGPPPPHHGHPPPPSGAYPPYHHPHGYYGSPPYPPPHAYHHHGGAPAYGPPPPPPPPPAVPYRPPRQQALPQNGANPELPEPVISRTQSHVVPEEGSGQATGGTDKGSSKSISNSSATRGMPPSPAAAPAAAPPQQRHPLLESSSYISGDDGSPPRKSMSATNRSGSSVDVAGQTAKEYSSLPSAFTPPRGGARIMSYHYDPYHQASAYPPPPPPPDYYGGPPPYAPPPPVYDPYEPYNYSTTAVQPQPNVNSGDVVQASVSDELEPNYRGGVPPPPPMAKGSNKNNNNHHQQFRKGGRSIHSEPVILRKKFSWRNYFELEEFLIANRSEYLRHSALNYTAEQKHFNNRLTEGLLEVAARMNYVFDESCFNFVAVRDRIRCYYKSFVQSSKKRGIVVGFPPNQGEEEMMENQHNEGTINDYHYGVSG